MPSSRERARACFSDCSRPVAMGMPTAMCSCARLCLRPPSRAHAPVSFARLAPRLVPAGTRGLTTRPPSGLRCRDGGWRSARATGERRECGSVRAASAKCLGESVARCSREASGSVSCERVSALPPNGNALGYGRSARERAGPQGWLCFACGVLSARCVPTRARSHARCPTERLHPRSEYSRALAVTSRRPRVHRPGRNRRRDPVLACLH